MNATLGNANDNGGQVITSKLTGIEIINVAFTGSGGAAGATTTLDLQDATGQTEVNITRISQAMNRAEVANIMTTASKLSLANTNANTAGTAEFSYGTNVLKGLNTGDLTVSNVQIGTLNIGENTSGVGAAVGNFGVTLNSFETLNLKSTGTANIIGTLALPMDTGNDGSVVISGDKDLTLAAQTVVTNGTAPNATLVEYVAFGGGITQAGGRLAKIDASALEGNLAISLGAGSFTAGKAGTSGQVQNLAVTGGKGNDSFYLADTIQAGDSLVGGAGNDKIFMVNGGNINAQSSVVSGIEAIRADINATIAGVAAATTTVIDFDKLPDVTGISLRDTSFDDTTNNVMAGGIDTFTLNNLTVGQAAGITVEHSTTGNNDIGSVVVNANMKSEAGANDTVAITLADNVNVDPRFNLTLNAGGTLNGVGVENVSFTDADTESNTIALGNVGKHIGTVTIASTTGAGKFFNLDTTTVGANGGLYNYLVNGQQTAANSTTGDGWLDGGTTAVRNLGVQDLSTTANQVKLVAATVNAATSTSDVVVRLDTARTATGAETATGGQNITMGSGNDTVIFDKVNDTRAGLTISDTVVGGAGSDTLVLDGNVAASVINISASEWTNVSGFETVRLVNAGAGSSYQLTLSNALIAANNSGGMLAIVNDNNPINDGVNMASVAGPAASSAVVIDARSLSSTANFSYNGAESTGATFVGATGSTADRFILSDANISGANIIDGGARWNNDGLIASLANPVTGSLAGVTYDANQVGAGNADVIEVRNASVVTVGDLANIKNVGTLSFTNDTASVQTSVLQLNDTVVDAMVNSYHTSSATAIGGVSQVETLYVNSVDNALVVGAFSTLNVDASALTAKSGLNIVSSGGADTIVGGASADAITGGAGADRLTGGGGADVFNYVGGAATEASSTLTFDGVLVTQAAALIAGSIEVITDFVAGTDTINMTVTGAGNFGAAAAVANATYAAALTQANTIFTADAGTQDYVLAAYGAGAAWTAVLFIDSDNAAAGTADGAIQIGLVGGYATEAAALAAILAAGIV